MTQCTAPTHFGVVRGRRAARCSRWAVWHGLCLPHMGMWCDLMNGLRRLMEQERAEHVARGGE